MVEEGEEAFKEEGEIEIYLSLPGTFALDKDAE